MVKQASQVISQAQHNLSLSKMPEVEVPKIKEVVIEGLVVMKIIKHCRENLPELVTGQLLGLDTDETLQVTNCFPFKTTSAADDSNGQDGDDIDADGADYQIEMMRLMREVNADNNTVGWYQSGYMGSYVNEAIIDNQFNYQENIGNSVVIIYDTVKTSLGALSLKALRLSDKFMDLYRSGDFTPESLKATKVTYADIFEEIPIRIHNNHLAQALFHELEASPRNSEEPYQNLDLSYNPFLEKNVGFLIETCDEFYSEQNKFQYYQRLRSRQLAQQAAYIQKKELENSIRISNGEEPLEIEDFSNNPAFKPLNAPNRLDSMIHASQIDVYHDQISKFATLGINKLYLADAIQ
eukprot:Nk52_evm1s2272 gene=Nk52_evmTU1s2272